MTNHIFWHLGIVVEMKTTEPWNTFNKLFATACPSVSSVEDGHSYSKFVFVSDRDKGLDKSLSEIFPSNHANCVHHIKQNVKTQFGPKAAEMVFPIANVFSAIQEETLLEQLRMKSTSAMTIWKKSQWSNGGIWNGLQHGSCHHSTDYHTVIEFQTFLPLFLFIKTFNW